MRWLISNYPRTRIKELYILLCKIEIDGYTKIVKINGSNHKEIEHENFRCSAVGYVYGREGDENLIYAIRIIKSGSQAALSLSYITTFESF